MKYSFTRYPYEKINLVLLISTGIILGCNKKDANNTTSDSMQYVINNVTDFSLHSTDSISMPLAIEHKAGVQERLILSVTGLPPNATYSLSNSSGTLTFNSVLKIKTNNTLGGTTYNLHLVGTTASNKVKNIDIAMRVNNMDTTTPSSCPQNLYGNYNVAYTTDHVNFLFRTGNISAGSNSNELFIYGFPNSVGNIKATVDCNGKTITIPSQTDGAGVNWNGSGIITINSTTQKSSIIFHYIRKQGKNTLTYDSSFDQY